MPQNPAKPTDPMKAVRDAAAELARARQKFPESMAKGAGVQTPIPVKHYEPEKPVHEEIKKSAPAGEGSDIASGIKWKQDQGGAVRDVMPKAPVIPPPTKFHKGGKIKKDGVQTIAAEKGETVLPNKNPKRVMELAMKHLDGMKDGMEAGKKKSAKKKEEPKKSESKAHKKVHPWKQTTVRHHPDGSHTMTQEHDMDATQDTSSAHPDDSSMMNALQSSMGPQTLAGAAGSPATAEPPVTPGMPS
jgi:hypothetical protein